MEILAIVCLILAIVAGVLATVRPEHARLVGVAVALIAAALLLSHLG